MMYSKNPERRSPPGKTCYLIVRDLCYHVLTINAIRLALEFPQNYPPKINLLSLVIHNFQKMAKI